MSLQAPFPWFGGKSRAASLIWDRLGDVPNYCEPFFGSGAVMLGRPSEAGIETVNDLDGFVANFWRAIQSAPDEVARWADWPVNENDLHARHIWLRERREMLAKRLEGDPDYCDPKIAGWWVWGLACWIGGGFCGDSGSGPWGIETDAEGYRKLVHLGSAGRGVTRKLVHLGSAGRGVTRRLVHLGSAGRGVTRRLVHLGSAGRGVTRQRVQLRNGGEGVARPTMVLADWFAALSDRLRRVRVCCGDWQRILGPTPTENLGITGIVLDPPYGDNAGRDMNIYAEESGTVAAAVKEWAVANGDNPMLRIALCGYEGEHDMPSSWSVQEWKSKGGYASQGDGSNLNKHRERIWFSQACLAVRAPRLW